MVWLFLFFKEIHFIYFKQKGFKFIIKKKIQHSLAMILVYLKKKSGLRFLKKEYHKWNNNPY